MSETERLILAALERRFTTGRHLHHSGCIHNLPPEQQVEMRGWSVDKWLIMVGALPEQITPDQWEAEPLTTPAAADDAGRP